MSVDKLNIRFNQPIYDQENIEKLKDKVNEIIDEVPEVNPEGEATEDLTKLKVGDTIYGVGGGTSFVTLEIDISTGQLSSADATKVSQAIAALNAGTPVYLYATGYYNDAKEEWQSSGKVIGFINGDGNHAGYIIVRDVCYGLYNNSLNISAWLVTMT